MNNKINISSVIWFVVGFIGTYVFGSKQKDHEGIFFSNIIIVENTDKCNNKCYHIHHWMWMLIIVVSFVIINTFISNHKTPVIEYTNLFALYFGAFISEYIKYGTDIFKIKKKCFPDCQVKRFDSVLELE